ncbi:MAG: EFR1 family ferrodoxin [Clostridiales bacterium]|jgi:ferredoxin|nr:EFR1 family ferrodoxin [Clostridiales bacterium]
MLTLYFSGTGNSKYIARLFSRAVGARCTSIEADSDFEWAMNRYDTMAFCYPVYGSRVPRIMREFVAEHMDKLKGKKIIIFATQMMFSGDGARAFADLFKPGWVEIIYAEHFNMPNNICNTPMLRPPGRRKVLEYRRKAKVKMKRVCSDISRGIVRKRGFSQVAKRLGGIQGNAWPKIEERAKSDVRIHDDCIACNLCVKICPMKNLVNEDGVIKQLNNCTVCYRCVNRCPKQAITVFFHIRPKWQYKGMREILREGK